MTIEFEPGFTGAIVAPATKRNRESSDNYPLEIARCGDVRLIECRDRIQWIIQRRVKSKKVRAEVRWVAIGHFLTCRALESLWHAKTGLKSGLPPNLPANFSPQRH
ncbi:hypothetical protein SAMN05444000_12843 [Shimia gijangensis]|uniref:Uncharacterized protein n=1 Tax=Shimia gijangensis TaxID=1470563 RepID=A0A1M6SB52_9RHOB|nr:hypothetical protein SAMN05444000_12843 [Shimia gijangensis]